MPGSRRQMGSWDGPFKKGWVSSHCLRMATSCRTVELRLPVICQPQLDECLKQSVPDAFFGPRAGAPIQGFPLFVALMHVAPGAADPKNMQHAVDLLSIIVRGLALSTARFR